MMRLAEEFFEMKNDPAQISVNGETMERLRRIHPGTLTEQTDGKGPIAWIMVIPTTSAVMEKFVAKEINERELLDATPPGAAYDALYLCSALVLPEHRGKGLARRLLCRAVKRIQKDHPIEYLFSWAFSIEGERLASSVARECALPLLRRL
jgi:ribosomal protein S18 acetylase RimI-like enzyme